MRVTLFVDPLCPWAWLSSRWLREACTVRDIEPVLDLMSQTMLYEKQELTDEQQKTVREMIKPLRVFAATAKEYGDEVLPRLYDQVGVRFHDQGLRHRMDSWSTTLTEALRDAGLDQALAGAADAEEFDARIRRSHEVAVAAAGPEAGTPVLRFDEAGGSAFFGPVISPAPRGEAAGRVWDGLLLLASTDGFYELKRSRTGGPDFG